MSSFLSSGPIGTDDSRIPSSAFILSLTERIVDPMAARKEMSTLRSRMTTLERHNHTLQVRESELTSRVEEQRIEIERLKAERRVLHEGEMQEREIGEEREKDFYDERVSGPPPPFAALVRYRSHELILVCMFAESNVRRNIFVATTQFHSFRHSRTLKDGTQHIVRTTFFLGSKYK